MTDTLVDIPGVGRVAFPKGMSDDQIADAIKSKILPRHGQAKDAPAGSPAGQSVPAQGKTTRFEVELPDGRIAEIDAPDRATAISAARKYMQSSGMLPPPIGSKAPASPVGKEPASPQAPVNPDAKPGAPDYGGPGGARRQWFEQPKAEAASIAPTVGDRIGRQLNLGTRAVGRGLADVVGTPVDLVTAVANAGVSGANLVGRALGSNPELKPIHEPVGGSESIKNLIASLADEVGLPAAPTDLTQSEKLVGRGIEGATSFVAPGAFLQRVGAKAAIAGKDPAALGSLTRPYAEAFVDAEKMAPGMKANYAASRPVAVDATAGAGANIGSEGVAEVTGSDTPLGRLLGSVAGGVGGAAGFNAAAVAGSAASRAPAALTRSLRGGPHVDPMTGVSPRLSDMAARAVQDATEDPQKAARNILAKDQQYRDAGISPPTAGLMSEDSGLVSVEKGLRQGDAQLKFLQSDRRTRGTAAETLDDLKPRVDPRIATDFADVRAAIDRGSSQTSLDTAAQGASRVAAASAKEADQLAAMRGAEPGASTRIDEVVRTTLGDQRAKKNALYDEAKAAGAEVARDISPFQSAANSVRAEASKLAPDSEILPKDFLSKIDAATQRAAGQEMDTGVLDDAGNSIMRQQPGENPSYADIAGLRPALAGAIARARAANQGGMVDALGKLKAEVEGETKRIAADAQLPGADPKLVALHEKIAAAEANYRENYAPDFVQGEGGAFRRAIGSDPTGATTAPSQTAKRFLTVPEKSADLARIIEKSASPAEAKQGVRDYLFAQVARDTLDGNKVSETRLNRWLAQNKDILASHPEAAQGLRDLQARVATNKLRGSSVETQLARAKANLAATEKEIQQSGLGLMLGKDPQNAIGSVFGSRDPERAMSSLVKQMGGKGSSAPPALAFKRAVADWVEAKVTDAGLPATTAGDVNPVSLAKLGKLDDRYDRALSQVFTPAEMNSMQMVRKAVTDLSRLSGVKGTMGPETSEDVKRVLNLTELVAKAHMGQLRGGGFTRTVKLLLSNVGAMTEGKKAAEVLSRAMTSDPELAAHLLSRPTTKIDRTIWNSRLNTLMGVATSDRDGRAE